jgi:hypothetical protein
MSSLSNLSFVFSSASIPLQPAQSSLVRFYATVLEFQLFELNLFVACRRTAHPEMLDSVGFDPRTSVTVVLGNCIKAAIRVLDTVSLPLRPREGQILCSIEADFLECADGDGAPLYGVLFRLDVGRYRLRLDLVRSLLLLLPFLPF